MICFISVNALQFIFKNFNKMFLSYLLICVWSHYPNILSLFRFNLFLDLMALCISAWMNAMQSEISFKKINENYNKHIHVILNCINPPSQFFYNLNLTKKQDEPREIKHKIKKNRVLN